jgi:hypothetical protein
MTMGSTSDPIPRARPGALVLGLSLLSAVGVIGYLLGMIRDRAEPTIARETATLVRADSHELDALHADLRELRDELSRPMPSHHEARAPALARDDTNARLVAVLERLEAAIGRLEGGQGQPVSRARDTSLFASLNQEFVLRNPGTTIEDGSEEVYAWMDERSRELTAQHALWSIDEVMATYGRPTEVESDNVGITLRYEIRRLAEDRGVEVRFNATSLRIVYVTVSYD